VLALANRIVPSLGGAEKILRATIASGPAPITQSFPAREAEVSFVVERVQALRARRASAPVETALARASIGFAMGAAGTQSFDQWWVGAFPGLAILTLVMAFNFIGDGVRDALDPRLRRGG